MLSDSALYCIVHIENFQWQLFKSVKLQFDFWIYKLPLDASAVTVKSTRVLKNCLSVVAVTFYFNVNTSERKTDLHSNAGSNGSIQHPNLSNRCPLCLLLKMYSDLPLVLWYWLYVLDPRSDAKGASGKRPKPWGDSGQDTSSSEGHGRGQQPSLHQQDPQERP